MSKFENAFDISLKEIHKTLEKFENSLKSR